MLSTFLNLILCKASKSQAAGEQSGPQSSSSSTALNTTATEQLKADVTGASTARELEALEGCIFCDVGKENGFNVVYEDEKYVAFKDHKPAAAQHLLVVPRRHIDSVRTLTKDDVSSVKQMAEIGHSVLDELQIPLSSRRLGFHIPPFYSVKHIHLHVQAAPYKSWLRQAKYPIVRGWAGYDKGFSWFVEVEQAIAILEKGGQVKISSC